MSIRDLTFYIVDIFIANDKIRRYISGFNSYHEFIASDIHWDATMRELQIIGDATNNLIKNKFLDNQFRLIVDFRNLITHAYFGIDPEMVWDIIHNELIKFIKDLVCKINDQKIDLIDAIDYAILEQKQFNNANASEFLEELKKKYSN